MRRSGQRHALVSVEGKTLTNGFSPRLRGVVGPHGIGDDLIAHHHIPVTGRALPAAHGAVARFTKILRVHRFAGEVRIAIHFHDVIALRKHRAVEDCLHGH